jgi:hypothetical protein
LKRAVNTCIFQIVIRRVSQKLIKLGVSRKNDQQSIDASLLFEQRINTTARERFTVSSRQLDD